MKRLLHRIAHLLKLQKGRVVTWFDTENRLMVAFKCEVCGKLDGIHHSYTDRSFYGRSAGTDGSTGDCCGSKKR